MRVPLRATYRIQLTNKFTFADAEAVVPYWRELGISHLYASPIFTARAGSQHGYDVVDATVVNPELGGEEAFLSLARALSKAGLGLILDIVPNHMGIGDPRNELWLNTLEFGPKGPVAATFDIDWNRGPVLIPFLGETLDKALESGDIKPSIDARTARIAFSYFDHVLPLRPITVSAAITQAAQTTGNAELEQIATLWAQLEDRSSTASIADCRLALQGHLRNPDVLKAIETILAGMLHEAARSHDAARALFDKQHWRLANWHTAQDEINYRRFFNISDLVALRAELPAVFEQSHRLPIKLIDDGLVDGLRADHVDGLSDPEAYCRRLRAAVGPDVSIHVEKILDRDERLRPWPIEGTTGYELLNLINGLYIDPSGYSQFAAQARKRGMLSGAVADRIAAAKRKVLTETFVAELSKVTDLAKSIADRGLETRDFTREAIRRSLIEIIVYFPVYRSYLTGAPAVQEDQELINGVVDAVCPRFDDWQQRVVLFIQRSLIDATADETAIELKSRFQQLTAPVMAKGYEDTELYRYIVLLSVNEVGGHIADPAISVSAFHNIVEEQAQAWPKALVPLATHDTKRGAGARARINVLSECANSWLKAVSEWSEITRDLKQEVSGVCIPDALDEELIYQTLLGSWPLTSDRLLEYLSKAMREAKHRTSWENPNSQYEAAVTGFAKALIDDPRGREFRESFESYIGPIVKAGRLNALSQTIVQFTFPGVPDLYWGTEFWDHAMVDPDNRRPVDWTGRHEALKKVLNLAAVQICDDEQGLTKIFAIRKLLELRQRYPSILVSGHYRPLTLSGDDVSKENWLAYARHDERGAVIILVPLRGLSILEGRSIPDLKIEMPEEWCGTGVDAFGSSGVTLTQQTPIAGLIGDRALAVILAGKAAERRG